MKVSIHTRKCLFCGESSLVTFDATEEQLVDFEQGRKNIQAIFPDMPVGDREMLISGTHSKCWDAMGLEEDAF